MFVAYDGMIFEVLFLDGWQIEADLSEDGADFLRWHHILDITCILNQDATAASKFPLQQQYAFTINNQIKRNVGNNAGKSKLRSTYTSGQRGGESAKKQPRKDLVPDTLGSLVGGAWIAAGTTSSYITPDGQVHYPPPPLSTQVPNVSSSNQYPPWTKILKDIPYAPQIGAQLGAVFENQDGGEKSMAVPDVSPGTVQATSVSTPPQSITGIDKAQLNQSSYFDVADNIRNIAAGIGNVVGPSAANAGAAAVTVATGGLGAVAGVQAGIEQGIRDNIRAQLDKVLAAAGLSLDDIFGAGKKPPKVNFPVPPKKRNENEPLPNATGNNNLGSSVPITFTEMESRLNKPRRNLAVWLNSGPGGAPEFMLFSPYPGFTADSLTGPTCKVMHIPAIHGNVTAVLKLRFETWVGPTPEIYTAKQLVSPSTNFGTSKLSSAGGAGATNTLKGGRGLPQSPANLKNPFDVISQVLQDLGLPPITGKTTVSSKSGGGKIVNNPAEPIKINVNGMPEGINLKANKILLGTPPIVSNRWSMRQQPDPYTYLNTTIIEGVAHFRTDVLQAYGITADQLRPFFMHPIPFGYVRTPPVVTLNSDGTSVNYQIVDVQQMMNNPGGAQWGVGNAKVHQHFGYNSPIDYVRSPFSPFGKFGQEGFGGIGNKLAQALGKMGE